MHLQTYLTHKHTHKLCVHKQVCVCVCVCVVEMKEEADRETDNPLLGLAERLLMHYGNKVTNSEVISLELPR